MSDYGLTEKGFKRKTTAVLIAEMEEKARELFGENVNTSSLSPLGIVIRIFAFFLATKWQLAEKVYYSAYKDDAEGVSLDKLGSTYIGITRRQAENATGEVIFSGDDGTIIPIGTLVSTEDGVQFETTETVTIETGTASASISAVNAGSGGNVPAETITVIDNPIAGLDSVSNAEPTNGGRDRETNDEFRIRYDQSVARGGSSTLDSIRASLLELEGVRDALVEHNDTLTTVDDRPGKSIEAFVFGGVDQEIAETILKTKAGGVQAYGDTTLTVQDQGGNDHTIGFTRPTEIQAYVNVTLTTDSNFPTNGNELVRTEIIKYIGGEDADATVYDGLGLGEDVVYIKIIAAIDEIPGITDATVEIGTDPLSLGTANIPIETKEVALTDWEQVTVT